MKRLHNLVPMLGIAAAALFGGVSCGGDDVTCGTGTVEMNGTCVPSNTTTCGTGTTLSNGQCVPDGSVICDQGTVYDMASGQCVVDPSACADGTVLVEGECVPEDETLTADHDEAAEPNDAAGAGGFDVPALDAMTSIHGCITPKDGAGDLDVWVMNASGPALLEITADGVGGLAAGFVVQDAAIPSLPNYARFGINLTGDTSRRQVYLPVAGQYYLIMDDSRALLTGEGAGNSDTCYYTTIKQVAMPAATAATLPQTAGTDSGNVRVLSYQADAVGDIFDITENTTSESLRTAFIVRKNGQFHASAAYDGANDVPPFYSVGGLATTDTVEIVVDSVYNFALLPQAYTLDFVDVAAQALPTDGTSVTVTRKNGTLPATPWWENSFLYFDVATAGQVLHFDVVSSEDVRMRIVRQDVFTWDGYWASMADIATSSYGVTEFSDEYIRFLTPGRYYLAVFDTDGAAATFTITSTLTGMAPTAVTYGTALAGQALPAQGSAFHTLDLTNTVWIQAGVPTAANWGGDARISLYDLAGEGWLGNTYNPVQSGEIPVDGSAVLERITRSDARDFLIQVEATAAVGTGPTYSLDIKERPHALLGEVMPGTPLTRTGMDDLAAGATKGFIVDGTAGTFMTAAITPSAATVDITAVRRNVDGTASGDVVDAGGAGAAETVGNTFVTSPSYQAFVVANTSGTDATNLSFNVEAATPRGYTMATGALAYVDACTGTGSEVLPAPFDGNGDDDFSAVQTLPAGFDFPFFGFPVRNYVVGANGFVTFGDSAPSCSLGCFSNVTIPNTAAPNNLIAGYWDDLQNIQVCRKTEATKVTLQFTGDLYAASDEAVQFQIVLNASGAIDLIYGAGHAANGTSSSAVGGTVGIESASASLFNLVAFNQNLIAPSTSYTFTPM